MFPSRKIASKRDTKADYDAQRRDVRERDSKGGGLRCLFERKVGRRWVQCGNRGDGLNPIDTVHVYDRYDCGKAAAHKDVAFAGCRRCHEAYHAYAKDVRVPPLIESRAWKRIVENSKLPPPRRAPEE